MNQLPPVKEDDAVRFTCFMPTYNRLRLRPDGSVDAVLLEEGIESYVRQSYPDSELLIINDTPGQTLRLPDDPRYKNITIFNLPTRQPTLGHKYRQAIELASGDYFTPWDDDDISLPNRLTTCRQYLRGCDAMTVHGFYFLAEEGKLTFDPNNGFMNDVYSVALARRVGYSLTSFGSDAVSRSRFVQAAEITQQLNPNRDWHFYIYRWSTTQRSHLSGMGAGEQGYAAIGRDPILAIDYELQPHWASDYSKLVQDFINGC